MLDEFGEMALSACVRRGGSFERSVAGAINNRRKTAGQIVKDEKR